MAARAGITFTTAPPLDPARAAGRSPLAAVDDRSLVRDLIGAAAAQHVDHVPVADLLDAGAEALAGLGLQRAARRRLLAAAELARRFQPAVRRHQPYELPEQFLAHLADLRGAPVEVLGVFALDSGLFLIGDLCPVAGGALMHVTVSAREVFAPAVERRAAAIVLVHNHPSGDPEPSVEDLQFTDRMARAGLVLGIQLLDHLVVTRRAYTSLAASGRLR